MELDSVRELKIVVSRKILATVARPVAPARILNLAAQPVEATAKQHPTIAIGVAAYGKNDYRLAVRIQRRMLQQGAELGRIQSLARGEVDLRYIGRVVKRAAPWHQRRNRPLRAGGSIGHYRITAGTLGCFVGSRGDSRTLILSNNHVLANENRSRRGDPILQPGSYDRGRNPADVVGTLFRPVRLKTRGSNLLDCAVASVRDSTRYNVRDFRGLGRLAGLGGPILVEGVEVAKVGRTTGVTRGRVTAFELDNVVVRYDLGNLRFDGQIEIEGTGESPFSDGGDSGSLILDDDMLGVGLLFAGSDHGGTNGQGLTYANPLAKVLDALNVALLH